MEYANPRMCILMLEYLAIYSILSFSVSHCNVIKIFEVIFPK